MLTPASIAARGVPNATGTSARRISPAVGLSTPARTSMSVDSPAPFAPTRACTSPASAERSTPSSAVTPGNVFDSPRISRNAITSPRLPLLRQGAGPPVVRPLGLDVTRDARGRDVFGGHGEATLHRLPIQDPEAEPHRLLADAGRERHGTASLVLRHPLQPPVVLVARRHDDLRQAPR